MAEILQTLLVTLGACAAAWLGSLFARQPGKVWLWSWVVPFVVLGAAAVALNLRAWSFTPPFSWLCSGWGRWIAIALSASMAMGALIGRLPKPNQRRALWLLCGVIILRTGTLPFISPWFSRSELETLTTQVDRDGVCLQGTQYNCGPASAVTALRKLGFAAEEGQLGLLCQTTPIIGTADDLLAEGLQKQYAPLGLVVERRYFQSVEELKAWPVAIAEIYYNCFVDHYVTVLGFKGSNIIIGDPLSGEDEMPVADFEKTWRHVAILLRRKGA